MRSWTEVDLIRAVADSKSIKEVYLRLGVSSGNSTALVRRAIERLKLERSHFDTRPRIKRKEELSKAIALRNSGLGYVRISKTMGLSVGTVISWVRHIKIPRSISQALAAARQRKDNPVSKGAIRKKLIAERGHRCQMCLLSEWGGFEIALELHRMQQGAYSLVPLLLLCPNCHATTTNWRGRGKIAKLKLSVPLAQMADASLLKRDCSGFESQVEHHMPA